MSHRIGVGGRETIRSPIVGQEIITFRQCLHLALSLSRIGGSLWEAMYSAPQAGQKNLSPSFFGNSIIHGPWHDRRHLSEPSVSKRFGGIGPFPWLIPVFSRSTA